MAIIGSGIWNNLHHSYVDADSPFYNAVFAQNLFDGSYTSSIVISKDGGNNFSEYDFENVIGVGENIIDFDFEGQNVVLAASSGVFLSNDYGKTFSTLSLSNTYFPQYPNCSFKEGELNILYNKGLGNTRFDIFNSSGTLLNTRDVGAIGLGPIYFPVKRTGVVLMVVGFNEDFAMYWNDSSSSNDKFPVQGSSDINSTLYVFNTHLTSIPPNSNSTIYSYVAFSGGSSGFIYKSSATGTTSFDQQKEISTTSQITVGAKTNTEVFIGYVTGGSNSVLYKSTDSALNFTVNKLLPGEDILAIKFNTTNNGILVTDTKVYHTTDGGDNWTESNNYSPSQLYEVTKIKTATK
jgi:hypothetical protein